MKHTIKFAFAIAMLSGSYAVADNPPPRPDNEEFEAALKECSGNSGQDMSVMDSCMEEKGFAKPESAPPNSGPGGEEPPEPLSN